MIGDINLPNIDRSCPTISRPMASPLADLSSLLFLNQQVKEPTRIRNILLTFFCSDELVNSITPVIFNNGRYTTNILTDPHTVTTTDIKTNMRHIHTSIVSRHLATRGNNKILRTLPPHTSSAEEIRPRLPHRTLAQLRTNKSPFLKSCLHKVDDKSHPSPLCPLCNTHTHDTHHTVTPGFVDRPRWSDGASGQM